MIPKNIRQKKWRDKNKAKIKAYLREWRKNNPEKLHAYNSRRRTNWRKDNPEKHRLHNLKYRLKHKYGLSIEDKENLIKKQKGTCASCKRPLINPKIDHCHKTGKVRGILCHNCNVSLGLMQENPKLLRLLAKYAEKLSLPSSSLREEGRERRRKTAHKPRRTLHEFRPNQKCNRRESVREHPSCHPHNEFDGQESR